MQFSHALIALVAAGLANAQLPDIPQCSMQCFVKSLTSDGCSNLMDFACHCSKPQLVSEITPCVQKACPEADQSSVSNVVVSQCSAAGHPIDVPPIGGGSSSSEGGSEPTSSSAAQPTASGSSSASGSASGGETPSATPTPSKTPSGTGSGSGPTGDGSVTMTAGPTASTPAEFPGAGNNVAANVGGVAAALLAVAAYL